MCTYRNLLRICLLIAVTGFQITCGDKQDPVQTPSTGDVVTMPVTYTSYIAPLLETHYLRCHAISSQGAERNGAPINVNFDTYEDTLIWSDLMNQRIQSGTMPPGGNGIPDDDRQIFQEWIDDGLLNDENV